MARDLDEIQLNDEDKKLLLRAQRSSGKPWRALLRELLSDIPRSAPLSSSRNAVSFLDVADKAGLVGCLKGGPPDLSTNPKYMEGFGDKRD